MSSNLVEFDLALIEQATQRRPRDIQQNGGLLGREFPMDPVRLTALPRLISSRI
jgi:hypothetical protein